MAERHAAAMRADGARGALRALLCAALLVGPVLALAEGEGIPSGLETGAELRRPAPSGSARAPKLAPEAVLPDVDPEAPIDVARAGALRDVVRTAREDALDALVRERIACYDRLLINGCLADVQARERAVRSRLDRIEVAVNRTLREAAAFESYRREAEAIAAREREAEADAARRAENRRAFEARTTSAEAARLQRDAEAPELARRAAANRAERERREAENAARRAESARDERDAAERARRETDRPPGSPR
jgi:flagellar biosynthesis GTPase FlhF